MDINGYPVKKIFVNALNARLLIGIKLISSRVNSGNGKEKRLECKMMRCKVTIIWIVSVIIATIFAPNIVRLCATNTNYVFAPHPLWEEYLLVCVLSGTMLGILLLFVLSFVPILSNNPKSKE